MEKRMLKVRVETIDSDDTEEIVIKCHEINAEVLELMKKLQVNDAKPTSLVGTKDEQIYTIKLKDILYIEATENKTFIYCADDFFESKLKLYELEEILIMSDIGVDTATSIISNLRDRIKKERLESEESVKSALKEEMKSILDKEDNSLKLETSPAVILVVGVNGVGKTTSVAKMAKLIT